MKIGIFGSYSGHNAGDDAILYSILSTLTNKIPNAKFIIPVKRIEFYKKNFSEFNVEWIPLGKKYLSVKFFGIQPYYALFKSDFIIMTQNMFFDYKINKRGFNVLKDWSIQIRMAKFLNKKIVGYNIGYGPIKTQFGKKLCKQILSCCDLITLREHEGKQSIMDLGVKQCEIIYGADPAINNIPANEIIINDIFKKENISSEIPSIGINANKYFSDESITSGVLDEGKYIEYLVSAANYSNKKYNTQSIVISTSFDDINICSKIFERLEGPKFFISNDQYIHSEIMGIMGRLEFLIGTRMHASVLSATMNTPVISINYVPKVKNFMNLAGLSQLSIDPENLEEKILIEKVDLIFQDRYEIKLLLNEKINELSKLEKRASEEMVNLENNKID